MTSSKSSEKDDDDEDGSMSDDSSRSIQNSEDDEERDTKKSCKKKSKVPSISLTLESFYNPEQAIQFAEEIMSTYASRICSPIFPPINSLSIADVAGITNPRQLKIDYDHLRYVIENDHCYTPLTYSDSIEATSMKKSSRKIDSRAVSSHTANAQPSTKKTINSLIGNKSQTGKSTEKDIGSASRSQNQNDSIESGDRSSEGEEAESEADFSDFSESESDNDRDSDLDFSVNDLHSRRSVKKRRKRKAKKMAAKKRREKETIDAGTSEGDTTANSRRRSYASKRDLSVDNSASAETSTPKTPRMKMGIKGPRDQPTDDATPSPAPKPKLMKQLKTITPKVAEKKSSDVLIGDMTSLFSSPDIIKKVGSGPSGSTAQSLPVSVTAAPVVITHRLLNGTQPQFRKKIIQVKLASEQDKQLDLIDSLVQEELKRDSVSASLPTTSSSSTVSMSSSFISENSYIPSIMKMLETSVPDSATAESSKVESSAFETDQFLPDELLEGLANSDDCLTEDLLKDVAKLAEDKNLQELIDQQVLAIAKPPLVVVQHAVRRDRLQKAVAPLAGGDPHVVINPPKPHTSVITATVTTPNSKQEPIKIIRSGGRIITLPPIEAPTTRGAKRRAEIPPTNDAQSSKKPIILNSLIDLNATATSKGLTFLGDVARSEPKERRASVQSAKRNSTETPKRTLSVENSMLVNAFDDDDDYDDGSDGSYNSEDDPLRYEIIYVY